MPSAFSNYILGELQNGPLIYSATVQRHDGVDDTIIEGFDPSAFSYQRRPWDHFFLFQVPEDWWPPDGVTLDVETGFLETPDSAFQQDTLQDGPVQLPEVELVDPEDILEEIEAVLVPS